MQIEMVKASIVLCLFTAYKLEQRGRKEAAADRKKTAIAAAAAVMKGTNKSVGTMLEAMDSDPIPTVIPNTSATPTTSATHIPIVSPVTGNPTPVTQSVSMET